MNLIFRRVRYGGSHYRKVRRLYFEAFPPIEQLPLWVLCVLALRSDIEFYAVYADTEFCGLLYLVNDPDHTLIFYFAVRTDLHSRGYGAAILQHLKNRGGAVSLIMESMREVCENATQRQRRKEFYLRNGFLDTGYYMKGEALFDILCTVPDIDPIAYQKLVSRPMFWLRRTISVGKF